MVGSLLYLQASANTWHSVTASVTLDWIYLPILNPLSDLNHHTRHWLSSNYIHAVVRLRHSGEFCYQSEIWSLKQHSAHTPSSANRDHWESSCWHCLALKYMSVSMDLFVAANACANGYEKCVLFLPCLLKWHELFPSISYGSWISDPCCILSLSSCTRHHYFWNPTFVSNSFSNCLSHSFPQLLCFNPPICPPELHRRYLILGHCFNHTNLSRSLRKITILRFKISHPGRTTALHCSVLGFCYRFQPEIYVLR